MLGPGQLTSCIDKGRVVLLCEEGVRQISEELLEQTCHPVHIVEEVLGITEVQILGARVCEMCVSQMQCSGTMW